MHIGGAGRGQVRAPFFFSFNVYPNSAPVSFFHCSVLPCTPACTSHFYTLCHDQPPFTLIFSFLDIYFFLIALSASNKQKDMNIFLVVFIYNRKRAMGGVWGMGGWTMVHVQDVKSKEEQRDKKQNINKKKSQRNGKKKEEKMKILVRAGQVRDHSIKKEIGGVSSLSLHSQRLCLFVGGSASPSLLDVNGRTG